MRDKPENISALLVDFVAGELPPDVAARLEQRIADDAALQDDVAYLRSLQADIRELRADSFAPYFSDRVMRRLKPMPAGVESLAGSLQWMFARASVVAAVVAVVIGVSNAIQFGDMSVTTSTWEAIFGLPSADLFDAFLSGPT